MRCEKCGEPIKTDERCYQVRWGHMVRDGDSEDFVAEEDVAYFCEDCGVERGNFSS